jgi:transcriptional regulator with PAS, ATPase and Fis domain
MSFTSEISINENEFNRNEDQIKQLIKSSLELVKRHDVVLTLVAEMLGMMKTPFREMSDEYFLKIAKTDDPILITGKTGTGKELVAKLIHYFSGRMGKDFIAINCAGIPANLIEHELFGHKEGAFTGATKKMPGYFETYSDGTIFLDEIGDMPFELQAKILRVLNNGEYIPLGCGKSQVSNARVVCATNQDLFQLIRDGRFREDLYYRINTFEIDLLTFSEQLKRLTWGKKKELFYGHLNKEAIKNGIGRFRITKKALQKLMDYQYPGNYRELNSILRRIFVYIKGRKNPRIETKIIKLPLLHSDSEIRDLSVSAKSLSDINILHEELVSRKLKKLAKKHSGIMINAALEEGYCKDRNDKNGLNKFRKLCQDHGIDFKHYRI